jgi:putrescine aminotransferase
MREATLARYERHIGKAQARLMKFINAPCEIRSEGALIFDEDDEAHLDAGGYGVFFLGHVHPHITGPVSRQLFKHPLACRSLLNVEHGKAAEALLGTTPEAIERIIFATTGAEAVEIALKLARLNGKKRIISMENGFHGKSCGALSVTGNDAYRDAFLPLLPDVTFIAFGNAAAAEATLRAAAGEACLIVEPIQGEGGGRIPPVGYLARLSATCTETGNLLIVDEIQTGMGRTGHWWSSIAQGVIPDILLAGKGLGGGVVPVSAVMGTGSVFRRLDQDPLLHSSTFAANPLAMVAVQATLDVIMKERYLDRARLLGRRLLDAFSELASRFSGEWLGDVRGEGLLLAIEFAEAHIAIDFMLELMRHKVIACHALNSSRTVRFTPPVVLTEDQIIWLVSAVDASLRTIASRYGGSTHQGGVTCSKM